MAEKSHVFGTLLGLLLSAVAGCSLLLDFNECKTDADCASKGGGTCQEGICQRSVELLGGPCQEAVGPVDAENALIFGVILPLTGDEAGVGIPMSNAVRIAQTDINGGGGILGRPLGLVFCDSQGRDDVAFAAATHLVNTARVPAIVGPDFSRQTIEIATQLTIPNDVALVTPSGTAAAISTLTDKNLVWRTCPSDNLQGSALAEYVNDFISNRVNKPADEVVVWSFHQEADTYGAGLQETLNQNLDSSLVASPRFITKAYPANWPEWLVSQLSTLDEPDVVIVLGASEGWDIAEEVELRYPGKAMFFFADGAKNPGEAARTSPSLEGRIRGVAPQNIGGAGYTPFINFATKYRSVYDANPAELQFVANAYDALVVLAFGAAGGGGATGLEIADGMTRISDSNGQTIEGSQTNIQIGFQTLSNGGSIDYLGASGPLNFDASGDPSNMPIALWCFTDGAVPEEGLIVSETGVFSYIDCDTQSSNNTNNELDMGTDVGEDMDFPDLADM